MISGKRLSPTGFDFADDYSERRWMIGESLFHEVWG
jgi:hypothetical protein